MNILYGLFVFFLFLIIFEAATNKEFGNLILSLFVISLVVYFINQTLGIIVLLVSLVYIIKVFFTLMK